MLVNVGTAQVELLKDPQRGSSDVNPLARFMIGGLWVSYRMTYAGQLPVHLNGDYVATTSKLNTVLVLRSCSCDKHLCFVRRLLYTKCTNSMLALMVPLTT